MHQGSTKIQLSANRRSVLSAGLAVGGALVLGVHLGRTGPSVPAAGGAVFAPDAFIRIARDGRVTLVMPQVEMGQGIYTAMATLIAEELDIALDRVILEAAPASDRLYGNPLFGVQMTGGSTSMRAWWTPMRRAGAQARGVLVVAAAEAWRVGPETCRTGDGRVHHDPSGRSLPYGALVAVASRLKPPADPPLKAPADFRLIGKPFRRLDTPDKVNGTARYGIDAMPKGVRFAALITCPVFGGRVAGVDDRHARRLPGVQEVVVLDDLVAVVGDHWWAAKQGLDALDILWDEGANANVSSKQIWRDLEVAARAPGAVAETRGDAPAQLKGAGVIAAAYELPFLAHAAMEPMNCTVHVRPGACEIWVGTQVMTKAQAIAAEMSGLRPEQVTIHNHLLGGGFGRRLEVDGIGKAVRIACRVNGPVKVIWSREEDIQKAMYRPVYRHQLAARLADRRPVAWTHRVAGSSILARFLPLAVKGGVDPDAVEGAIELPYDIPNVRTDYVRVEPQAVPTAFWRGVGPNGTIFSVESFMDRLAQEARVDPLDFRRALLARSPRALAVLELATANADWGKPLPPRSGRGLCVQSPFGSFLSVVAEVSVEDDGEVRVRRLTCAADVGTLVNPDTVVAQIQGGMIFGLTAILHGEITLANGRVQQSNFHDYRMLRIDETPRIDVHLVANGEAPGGIGEPGTVAVGPAVANAIYAATGVQLTRLPVDRRLLAKHA
jgi:isoquinoline 1-oxidoreductase beta subunit